MVLNSASFTSCMCPSYIYYLLTYSAITICYRSWPQLIWGAIVQELLQLGANLGSPAFLDSLPPVWPNAGEAVLLYELVWSYPYERVEYIHLYIPNRKTSKTIFYPICSPNRRTSTSLPQMALEAPSNYF